jgi:hypothetical protein
LFRTLNSCPFSTIFQYESFLRILPSLNSNKPVPRTFSFSPEAVVPVRVHSEHRLDLEIRVCEGPTLIQMQTARNAIAIPVAEEGRAHRFRCPQERGNREWENDVGLGDNPLIG